MLKYSKVLFLLIVYFIIDLFFLLSIPKDIVNIHTPYVDFYLFLIISIIYIIIIFDNKVYINEINRFKKIKSYTLYKLKIFTIKNLLIVSIINLINIVCLLIVAVNINLLLILKYTINLFIIFEILYLLCYISDFFTNNVFKKYCLFILFIIMYTVCLIYENDLLFGLNIFTPYLKQLDLKNVLTIYLFWVIIPVFIICNIKEKIEL